jgi:putative acyl-CoA dehydrogenase
MTHEVFNQPPPLENRSLFETDPLLSELKLPKAALARLKKFGQRLGQTDFLQYGVLANENPPILRTHDRYGHRVDQVQFHPSYHELMSAGMAFGIHSLPWEGDQPSVEAHLERAAGHYLLSQVEAGVGCPLTMTFAGVPALVAHAEKELCQTWVPKLTSRRYDPRFLPVESKTACTMGMAMTEKQGGSDVRANTTQARPVQGNVYSLRGHKWFCSAPMSDAFLTLAQTPPGITCFFVPRFKPDGEVNSIRVMRLKNKLGNKSNASSEIEYDEAWAVRVGEEGRGVSTIIEMVNHTRLDCVIGSAALMRAALAQALHHACHRRAFGAALIDQPLMRNVLADLCLEAEASWRMMVRLCQAYGRSGTDRKEKLFARFATAVAKFWVCKRTPMMVGEALECLGGNGYTEDFPLSRLYREAPLSSVWEGSGNVISLDLLRAFQREPESVSVFLDEVSQSPHVTRQTLEAMVLQVTDPFAARNLAKVLALQWQAQLMEQSTTPGADGLFFPSRWESRSSVFGTLVDQVRADQVLDRFAAPFLGGK